MDYHCNSSNSVAARLFRWEHKSKFSKNRQLDPYSDRYCHHPHYFAGVGDRVVPCPVENKRGDLCGLPLISNTRKEKPNGVHNYYRFNSPIFDWLPAIKPVAQPSHIEGELL